MDLGNEGLLPPEAVADSPVFARARAVAHFEDGPVRQLVHRLNDVMTSGATANAASRSLLRGGAKRVDVLVFARAV